MAMERRKVDGPALMRRLYPNADLKELRSIIASKGNKINEGVLYLTLFKYGLDNETYSAHLREINDVDRKLAELSKTKLNKALARAKKLKLAPKVTESPVFKELVNSLSQASSPHYASAEHLSRAHAKLQEFKREFPLPVRAYAKANASPRRWFTTGGLRRFLGIVSEPIRSRFTASGRLRRFLEIVSEPMNEARELEEYRSQLLAISPSVERLEKLRTEENFAKALGTAVKPDDSTKTLLQLYDAEADTVGKKIWSSAKK